MTTLNLQSLQHDPLIQSLQRYQEIFWFKPERYSIDVGLAQVCLTLQDVEDAEARLSRFAPYLAQVFPETQHTFGKIESELVHIPTMKKALSEQLQCEQSGAWYLKKDSHLPISGSIKSQFK